MLDYVWLVLAFPALGVLINGFFSRCLGRKLVGYLACIVVGLSFVVSLLTFWALIQLPAESRLFEKALFTWLAAGDFIVEATLRVDPLSTLMILVVSGVGFVIHVYSIGYMHGDPRYGRYFTYLNLFLLSMLLLILASNFLLLYVGWELVGLCSYLLIGFWFERQAAANAGKKAFITTRIGDFGFALGVMLIFVTFGTLNYGEVFEAAPATLQFGGFTATAITLLLFMGAVGKSAQIPLYVWLPDAMEGPTPVSALIHAATMVTAGVYMVARTHVLFELAPLSMTLVAVIGAITAFYAATIALVQSDIKRVLAYSTISQLGYMFMAMGVGAYAAGMFHLTTHAFFKALLFLGAGSVMHALANETDMQKMGGLYPRLKITALTFMVGWLAISGIPPFAGFFSKDEILAEAYHSGYVGLWALGVITAFLTAFYSSRQVFLTFWGKSRMEPEVEKHAHESPPVMTVPLIILAVLAAVSGFLGLPAEGGSAIHRFLSPIFAGEAHVTGEVAAGGLSEIALASISTGMGLLGIGVAWAMYIRRFVSPVQLAARFQPLYRLLLNKYYVDELYGFLFIRPFQGLAHFLDTVVDAVVLHDLLFVRPFQGLASFLADVFELEVIGGIVNDIAALVNGSSRTLRRVQTGYMRNYALSILFGVVAIVAYLLLR